MRIPPYYRQPQWQRFFAGIALGSLISWCVFLYIFGEWQEDYSKIILKQEKRIEELIQEKKIWQEDIEKLNKINKEKLTIQELKVKIIEHEKYHLDPFSIYEMEKEIEEDIGKIIAKDIETAFNSSELIEKAIENRTFKIHDKRYRLKVQKMVFYTTFTIHLTIVLDE